jgi:hypothetical protein
MKLIALFALSLVASAQQTITPANVVFSADAVAALQTWFLTQITGSPTALAAPMTAGATTMTVVDGTVLAVNQEFLVDNEAVNPTAIAGNVVTITRADLGTTAVSHLAAAPVQVLKYRSLRNFCKQVLAAAVIQIMVQTAYPTAITQNAAIAAAQAAKDAAAAAAVQ